MHISILKPFRLRHMRAAIIHSCSPFGSYNSNSILHSRVNDDTATTKNRHKNKTRQTNSCRFISCLACSIFGVRASQMDKDIYVPPRRDQQCISICNAFVCLLAIVRFYFFAVGAAAAAALVLLCCLFDCLLLCTYHCRLSVAIRTVDSNGVFPFVFAKTFQMAR